jgi:hypothetical protein
MGNESPIIRFINHLITAPSTERQRHSHQAEKA